MKMLVAMAVACLLVGVSVARESDDSVRRYQLNIPQQGLGAALKELAEQTGLQVALLANTVDGQTVVGPVAGELTAAEALGSLLKEKGLDFRMVNEKTIAVVPVKSTVRLDSEGHIARNLQNCSGLSTDKLDSSTSLNRAGLEAKNRCKSKNSQGKLALVHVEETEGVQPVQTNDGESSLNSDLTDENKLEEIVVTAQKREERLIDVPMSITALDEQQLIKMGATGFFDYATKIPNLSFGASGDGVFTSNGTQIRGIAGVGTTGFYIDDVPIPDSMNPKVMDISRIEVLRGPQGSLYGARSMGGTVRLITKRADPARKEFKSHATVSSVSEGTGNYAADGAFNLPISDTAAIRGSGYFLRDSGVYDLVKDDPNVAGDELTRRNVDDAEHWGAQAVLSWNVTPSFTVEPRFMYQKSHLDGLPFADYEPGNFTNHRVVGLAEPNEEHWSVSSLTLKWEREWGDFVSATAYLDRNNDEREDFTEWVGFFGTLFGAAPGYIPAGGTLIVTDQSNEQLTQELRFTSSFPGRLQITAGAFYSDNENHLSVPCARAVGFEAATGLALGTECVIQIDDWTTTTEEAALFGELELELTERLSVIAGGRFFDTAVEDSLGRSGLVYLTPSAGPRFTGRQSEHGFNPKLALNWRVDEDWMLYGTAAKGFRIGGANTVPPPPDLCGQDLAAIGLSSAPEAYRSDSLWNYEIGSKSTYAEGRFSLNTAVFLMDWKDMQQSVSLFCGFGFGINAGSAESKGIEIEFSGRPIQSLTYTLGVGYTDAKITDPEGAPGVLKGRRLPQVPEWTFTGNADYRFAIGRRESYLVIDYSWIDRSISVNQGLSDPRVRPLYRLLDARLGMMFGNLDVALFGKNLTNEHANLSDSRSLAAEMPGRPRIVTNRPRTIGIDFRWTF